MSFRARDYLARPARLLSKRTLMASAPSWEPERLRRWQVDRLRGLLGHARRHVPYYRRSLAHIDPRSVRELGDWSRLPVLTRDQVREHVWELESDDASRRSPRWRATSGTTGSPIRVLHDRDVDAAAFNLFWRQWSVAPGWRLGKRQVVLSGDATAWHYRRLPRILYVPSFEVSSATIDRFVDLVGRYRPTLLRGFPSVLATLAGLIERSGRDLTLPGVVTYSEMLLPMYRSRIERVFGATVVDHYTHWERAASIGQCRAGRYHVHGDFGHVEILRDGSPAAPGETGRIVATGLHNRAMPLFRYDTGDTAAWSTDQGCGCGSRFPIVESIGGRADDLAVTPDGRRVPLSNAFNHVEHLRQAQVVQHEVESVIVHVVTEPGFGSASEALLLRELRRRLGPTMRITLERSDEIPRAPSGKMRLVVSELGAVPAGDRGAAR